MDRVCVVGGGTAGLQAAFEASCRGSDVTVVEKDENPDLPWRDLPALIGPGCGSTRLTIPPLPASVRVLASEARSCKAGLVATTSGDVFCDSLVLATGSTFEPPGFTGWRKPGVYLLSSQRSYEDLGRDSGSLGKTVIAGEGRRALEVADRLTGGGRSIDVVVSSWQGGTPSRLVLAAVSKAARERNVSIASGRLTDVVGAGRVEAAVVEGEVLLCDSVVYTPRRLPRVPITHTPLGPSGAVIVGRDLAAGTGAYAAGGCAELDGGGPQSTLAGEPGSSGRIAGANCLGEGLRLGSACSTELLLFGLRWFRMVTRQASEPHGSRTSAGRSGDGTACEIAFDRQSGRVTGIEFVNAVNSPWAGEVPSTIGLDLKALAYGAGSSDISMISETARQGLARWQRY